MTFGPILALSPPSLGPRVTWPDVSVKSMIEEVRKRPLASDGGGAQNIYNEEIVSGSIYECTATFKFRN